MEVQVFSTAPTVFSSVKQQELIDMDDSSFAPVVKNGGKEVRLYPYVRRDTKTGFFEYSRPYPSDIEVYENGKRKKNYFRSLSTREPVEANRLAPARHGEFERIVASEKAKGIIPYGKRQAILQYLKEYHLVSSNQADIDLFTLQKVIMDYQENVVEKMIDKLPESGKASEKYTRLNKNEKHDPLKVIAQLRNYEKKFQGEVGITSILHKRYAEKPIPSKPTHTNQGDVDSHSISDNASTPQINDAANNVTLRDALNIWLNNKKGGKGRAHRSKLYKERPVILFEQVHGTEKTLAQITEEDLMQVVKLQEETPMYQPKKQPFQVKKELTLPELNALYKQGKFDGKKPTASTVVKTLEVYANLYDLATLKLKARKLTNIARILLKEYKFDFDTGDERERDDYSIADLKKLFNSPLYTGCKSWNARTQKGNQIIKDNKYWLPLIGLFTGMREEEIGQLSISDIREYGNVRYISINSGDNTKRLKNKKPYRYVPIHQEVIKCGFWEYYAGVKAAGHSKLFPELVQAWEKSKDKRYTKSFSQWYNRYAAKIGIKPTEDEAGKIRKDFHSFRHVFKTECRNAKVEDKMHDFFTGHARPKNEGGAYGKHNPAPYEEADRQLQKVRFIGLDLSHLYTQDNTPPKDKVYMLKVRRPKKPPKK